MAAPRGPGQNARETAPQLPCWWRQHRSERPRSKDQSTTRSSVRSHRIVRSQPDEPRRHHCSSLPSIDRLRRLSAASAGRPPSLWAAAWRLWPVREAPKHNRRAIQRARGGALSGASALRPRAAAFCVRLADARCSTLHRPDQPSRAALAIQPRRRLRPRAASTMLVTVVGSSSRPPLWQSDRRRN